MRKITSQANIVVIGGGLAGTFAAISAARMGQRTILVQDRPVLGGNASSEMGIGIAGADCSSAGLTRYARESGLIDEYMLEVLFRSWNLASASPLFSVALWEMAGREPNLSLYLNTYVREVRVNEQDEIATVTAVQTTTEREYTFTGTLFIDCTGHGSVGALAGAEFRMGREGKTEFKESLAPDLPDSCTMGASIIFRARDMGRPVPFVAPEWAVRFPTDKDLPHRHPEKYEIDKGEIIGFWWLEYGGRRNTIDDGQEIHEELLRILYGLWDHMKNSGDHGVANYAITKIDLLAGHRESRRLIGDYIVNENDVRSGTLFPDRVAYAGWPIDVHPPGGIYDKEPPCTHVYLPHFWSIPFRCLYSKNIPNLLFAGRNISASHVALGSCRVMATCAAEGQAVGTAAALCSREKLTPRQLGQNKIHLLQQQLLKDDCYLIGIKNEDPADAALQATISSSSQAVLEPALPEDFQELDNPCAQMFPVSQDRINMVELYLTSTLLQPVIIPMGLRAAQDINDFKSGEDIGQGHQTIEPGFEGWLRFDLDMSVLPGRFYWIHLPAVPGVKWAAGKGLTFGTNRAVYQAKKWPQWRAFARTPFSEPFLRTFCFRLTPESKPYGPANIISGVTRPETQTNIWISNPLEKLPQWINFNFDHPISLSKMHVTLDDDLDANIYHPTPYGRLGRGVPETLLSEYRLLAKVQNSWRPVLHMIHNHQRRRIHRFDPIHTQKLRFEALATHGAPEARVYEIRFYGK